jgi:lipopolysaccharide/colanic/teichoic acid biosynthesis glycosyltransferase
VAELSIGQVWRNDGRDRQGRVSAESGAVVSDQSGLALVVVGATPVVTARHTARSPYFLIKRFLDITVACSAVLLLMPLLLFVGAAIKLTSPGPVIFRQIRLGRNNAPFVIYKLRTMPFGRCDPTGVSQTQRDDPRVRGLGAWLRRTSFDELPQLINVIRGEISLVGPRPHVPGQLAAGVPYACLVPYYALRTAVKPGLTGWAQANGLRGPTVDAELARRRIDHDIAYIQNASIWLDLKILWLTLKLEIRGGTGV